MPEFYKEQPKELPETLPDGTKDTKGWAHFGLRLMPQTQSKYSYERAASEWGSEIHGGGKLAIMAHAVAWETVPLPTQPEFNPGGEGEDDSGYRERLCAQWNSINQKASKLDRIYPPIEVKPDPYTNIPDLTRCGDYLAWSQEQDALMRKRVAQAKAELDRPARTGPLKNRDRWGQLIGGGWETPDE